MKLGAVTDFHREYVGRVADEMVVPWSASLSAGKDKEVLCLPVKALNWILGMPMQTCTHCQPLHQTCKCLYRSMIRSHGVLRDEAFRQSVRAEMD
jgi:hypothetical protein